MLFPYFFLFLTFHNQLLHLLFRFVNIFNLIFSADIKSLKCSYFFLVLLSQLYSLVYNFDLKENPIYLL